ncbi:hypothetical protein EV363DRAFT_595678 [Boletus edulis]|nr:hypothetical protein EV363DRAFT_595678 [Boletus edulis]
MTDTPTDSESRSLSRGRDTFKSSGRGGAGNIRNASLSRDERPTDGPDDFSHTRGREPVIHPDRVYSVGRGGAGNIRSPSRDAYKDASETEYQAKLVREHAEATTLHSSGRGGTGNISGSRSRSRGPAVVHSSGRGGAGNIHVGSSLKSEALDDEERMQHVHHETTHSTGRGGVANITAAHEPDIERVTHHLGDLESTGRGGVGNIRSRSASRDPGGRAASKEKHGIAAIFDKFAHPHQHAQPAASAPDVDDLKS